VVDWETVRQIALAFPEVEEYTSHGGHPALRVRKKLFAWMSPKREAEGALAVRVDRDEKQLLIEANPEVYYSTPHYEGYPALLIRLDAIERDELAERLEDAWLIQAPKRLAASFIVSDNRSEGKAR
jgi:hypothetical protein